MDQKECEKHFEVLKTILQILPVVVGVYLDAKEEIILDMTDEFLQLKPIDGLLVDAFNKILLLTRTVCHIRGSLLGGPLIASLKE